MEKRVHIWLVYLGTTRWFEHWEVTVDRTPRVGVGGGQGQKFSKNKMFFRTQRTLSENILMIFDPLPVKFLPQKKIADLGQK